MLTEVKVSSLKEQKKLEKLSFQKKLFSLVGAKIFKLNVSYNI